MALAEERSLTDEELLALPPEAHAAIAAVVRQQRAVAAKAAEAEAAAAEASRRAASDAAAAQRAKATALDWRQGEAVRAYLASLAQKTAGQQPDPSSPEGIAWLARKQLAEELGGFFRSLETHQEQQAAAAEAAASTAEYETYIASMADFSTRRKAELDTPDVLKEWREFMEAAGVTDKAYTLAPEAPGGTPRVGRRWRFDPDKALDFVLARRERAATTATTATEVDEARRRVVPGSGVGRPKVVGPPEGMSPEQEARWYNDNADAVRASLDEARKSGALA